MDEDTWVFGFMVAHGLGLVVLQGLVVVYGVGWWSYVFFMA